MDEQSRMAIASSLGDPARDFRKQPLTQDEIEAVIQTYSKEILRPGLDPYLKEIYQLCVQELKKHLKFH